MSIRSHQLLKLMFSQQLQQKYYQALLLTDQLIEVIPIKENYEPLMEVREEKNRMKV